MKPREEETPFTIGICSFNLYPISDGLREEIERRLRGLPVVARFETLRDAKGETRKRIAWNVGEESPTYTKSDFTVAR